MDNNLCASQAQVRFGYSSVMKKVATKVHAHCAYGGEILNAMHPATAEHVKPHSLGGRNSDLNFLPVCQKHNEQRGNISLSKFIDSHPSVFENIKRTIAELAPVKTENFDGKTWAKGITKTVEKESKRHLDLVM